jgi:hypothetical protein
VKASLLKSEELAGESASILEGFRGRRREGRTRTN